MTKIPPNDIDKATEYLSSIMSGSMQAQASSASAKVDVERLPKFKALLVYCAAEGRVCPQPIAWHNFWKALKREVQPDAGTAISSSSDARDATEPPPPRILSSWWTSSDGQKRDRLIEQVEWAERHRVLTVADHFLRALADDEWAHGPPSQGTTTPAGEEAS